MQSIKRMKALNIIALLIIIGIAILLAGCETYHEKPIDPGAVARILSKPDLYRIRVRASKIKHPLLKPINIDLDNGLSPDEAAILAVILNPELRAIRDQKEIAQAQAIQAGVLPNPQISLSLEIPFGAGTGDKVIGRGLGLGWDIHSLITRQARVSAARSSANSVDIAVAWKEWQVAERAKLEAYRLFFAQQKNVISEKLMNTYKRLHDLMMKGLALRQKTVLDVSDAEYGLKKARESLIQSREEVAAARLALNQALGLPPQEILPLEKDITVNLPLISASQEQLLKDLQKTRLDLVALRMGYRSQEARVKEAIRGQFPRINISLSGTRDTDGIKSIGPSISIDLPFFNHNQGKIAIERATRQKLYDEYLARVFNARADVARIFQEIHQVRTQLDAESKFISEMEQRARKYMQASLSGMMSRPDYYRTLTRLYEAKLSELGKRARLAELGVALELATGRYEQQSSVSKSYESPPPCPMARRARE